MKKRRRSTIVREAKPQYAIQPFFKNKLVLEKEVPVPKSELNFDPVAFKKQPNTRELHPVEETEESMTASETSAFIYKLEKYTSM